jgi:hypothetical protein
VAGKFDGNAARLADAVAHAFGQYDVVAVAGDRSLPVWAMPMIGRLDCNSSIERP